MEPALLFIVSAGALSFVVVLFLALLIHLITKVLKH
jgi:hypothetical protein